MSLHHQSLLLCSPQPKTWFPRQGGFNSATPKLYSQFCPSIKTSAIRLRCQSKKKSNDFSIVAAQSNLFYKVWSVGKDGIEAGTNLVPSSVPRPVAKISVTVGAAALSLFVLKSLLSTVTFVLAMMGIIYFVYIALNKDEGPRGGGGGTTTTTTDEDSLEEARRIMEKYK
ncbi:uncharacterized protein LOC113296826 isoform X2 [Papaver somniferum]|uniref:uncharacterized protein LOC113296826 isoform X2 n=1 Tax=Papaver somniferum TaxID=3469 RepID=UPI000E703D1B|nr:uncharacterized protein LOC113296826 isoform X2 [Papaver somniferum]